MHVIIACSSGKDEEKLISREEEGEGRSGLLSKEAEAPEDQEERCRAVAASSSCSSRSCSSFSSERGETGEKEQAEVFFLLKKIETINSATA